ncbi:MAG: hypothetical protein J1E40_10715, partial [Oscillospiraceae bacterium]|nr:hypothetical protein [Oscillospiraceae bacterium]
EETTQTTPEETTTIETTTHEITSEEAAILAKLTDEEKEVWLTMPNIVTMRLTERYNANLEKPFSEFLYTEIICIDKLGQIKKITCPDSPGFDDTISWLNEKINMNREIELVDIVNIHSLIKFYSTFMCVDRKGKYSTNPALSLDWEVLKDYYFELYGIRSDGVNGFETLKISYGDAESIGVKCNYSDDWEIIDTYGSDTFKLYFKLDPLMKDLDRDWVVN